MDTGQLVIHAGGYDDSERRLESSHLGYASKFLNSKVMWYISLCWNVARNPM